MKSRIFAAAAIALMTLGCGRSNTPHSSAQATQPVHTASTPVTPAKSDAAPQPGKLHVFGDWVAGCDNGGDCTATTILPDQDDETDQILSMSVDRTAAGKLNVSVNGRQLGMDGETIAAQMIAGGRRFTATNSEDEPDITLASKDAAAFVGLHFGGKPIAILGRDGKPIGFVASKGLEQAIAYMDSVQRPLDGKPLPLPVIRNAYQRGAKPLQVSHAQIDRLRRQLQHRDHDCNADGEDEYTVDPLDADHSVFFVTCWAGLDNQLYAVYIAKRTPAGFAIEPAEFDFPAHRPGTLLYLNTHDEPFDEGELHQTVGGGGASNPHSFGPIIDYVWDGTRFRLASLTEASSLKHGYHDEITTWSAKVVP